MPQKEAILHSIKEFNRENGRDIVSPLLISEDSVTLEFQPPCSCKWGLLGAVYEFREELEKLLGKRLSVSRIKRIDDKGFAVRFFMNERELLRH